MAFPLTRGRRVPLIARAGACALLFLGLPRIDAQQAVLPGTLSETVARVVAASDPAELRVELGLGCLELLEETPDPDAERQVRLALGIALVGLERFSDAWDHLGRAAVLAREASDDRTRAHALWLQATSAFHLGRLDEGVECAAEGMDAAAAIQWDEAFWRLANMAGLIEERRGNSAEAVEAFRRGQEAATRVATRTGNKEGVSVLLGNFGMALMNLGDLDQALEIFEHARELKLESESQAGLASSLANLGDVLILLGRLEEARGYHDEALALREDAGIEAELALSYHSIGGIHLGLREFEAALALFEKSLEIRQRLELAPETTATLAVMAQAYAALDRDDEALDSAIRGLALADRLALKGRRLRILESLAEVHEARGELTQAVEVYRETIDLEREQRSLETQRRLADFRAQYEAQEEAQELALLSRERKLQIVALNRQLFERNALLVGGFFLAIAGLAGWIAWASLRRATKRIHSLEHERTRAENLEAMGVLAGGIAHDFNNILATVVGNLSILQVTTPPGDPAFELLEDASQGLEQGKQLARQLLTLAKGGVLARETQAIEPLIRESTSLALSGSRSKAVLTIEPELWYADVDSGQLRQLISNLVINADQAMPEGGEVDVLAANVRLQEAGPHGLPAGPYVHVTVIDHGAGIPPAIQERIFDPYFTTKEDGSGLGLALAYAIVQHHRGAITCSPTPGGGTSFEAWIPAAPDAPRVSQPPIETTRKGQGRILVMDDDPLLRRLYDRALSTLGYECLLVEDGEAAVHELQQALEESRPFQLAILDLTIPGGMGGQETIQRILEIDPEIRAIVASGYSDDRVLEDYGKAGFAGALVKPFTIAALSRAVDEASRVGAAGQRG